MATILPPRPGEPAPWFSAAASANGIDAVAFDELAGRYIVLFFFDNVARPEVAEAITALRRRQDLFGDKRAVLLCISGDPNDFDRDCVGERNAGQLLLWDSNGAAARQYGLASANHTGISPCAFILSPVLQIIESVPFAEPAKFVERIGSRLSHLLAAPTEVRNAPVLVVPRVFDRAFCERLIGLYESAGGREIGSIEYQGKVVERFDQKFRKRFDWYISDQATLQSTRELLERRLLPMVFRAFQFRTTRIERYLVGCYDSHTGGYFRPHRDNTAPIVAHRRFAVTINLNADYEGGHLRFPEFGDQTYSAAPGDAIVFSCSLLHEVTPVSRGRRYAFISFFYDEASQRMRDEYQKKLAASQPAQAS